MNKGRRIAGFALLAGVAIGLTFYVTRPREPVYQGKTLSEWLADLHRVALWPDISVEDQKTQDQAFAAVRQMGTNALPKIRKMLRADDSIAIRNPMFEGMQSTGLETLESIHIESSQCS